MGALGGMEFLGTVNGSIKKMPANGLSVFLTGCPAHLPLQLGGFPDSDFWSLEPNLELHDPLYHAFPSLLPSLTATEGAMRSLAQVY